MNDKISNLKIGEYFLKLGKITKEQLKLALNIQKLTGKKLGQILIELGFITHLDLITFLSLKDKDKIDSETIISSKISNDLLKKIKTIILSETENEIFVASLKPKLAKEILEKETKKKVKVVRFNYHTLINKLKELESKFHNFLDLDSPKEVLDIIMKDALIEKASDIHISPALDGTATIFMRIDGVRVPKFFLKPDSFEALISYIKQITGTMDISLRHLPQDGAFSYSIGSKIVDVRVSTTPTVFRNKNGMILENTVLRILDRDSVIIPLEHIGFTDKDLQAWKRIINKKDGIILICGATGSGKTTTIYSSLLSLDRIGKHIATVENPVEYKFPFLTQVQVNKEAGLDFITALKAFLRQDPDVILVGEVRDKETAEIMVQAGETGHLVFATLHSTSILVTLDRLKDLGFSIGDIKYLTRAILVQTLLRRKCRHCKGEGCKYCNYTGYKGRVLAYELLELDEVKAQKLIDMKNQGAKEKDIAKELSYTPIKEYAKILVEKGITDEKEYARVFGEEPKWKNIYLF